MTYVKTCIFHVIASKLVIYPMGVGVGKHDFCVVLDISFIF